MNIIGHLKEQADKAEGMDETRSLIENADMQLTDVELDKVSGGAGSNFFIYTVVKGDVLSKIAKRFRVSESDIIRWNKLSNPRLLLVGQKLTIYTK